MNKRENILKKRMRWNAAGDALRILIGSPGNKVVVLLFVFFVFIMSNWLPSGLEKLLKISPLYLIIIPLVVIGILVVIILKQPDFSGRVTVHSETPKKAKIVALFLSVLSRLSPEEIEKLKALVESNASISPSDLCELRRLIDKSTWKMPLIAIEYHRPKLEKVLVITSPGTCGSSEQYLLFEKVIKIILGENVGCEEYIKKGLDFEEISVIYNTINAIYSSQDPLDVRREMVIIDVTGGQKTNSIAGALAVLEETGRKIQYVSTNPPFDVKSYSIGYFPSHRR